MKITLNVYFTCYCMLSMLLIVLTMEQKPSYFHIANVSDSVSFTCVFSGDPVPSVNWSYHSSNDRISITADRNDTHISSTLNIDSTVITEDTDVYVCVALTPGLTGNVTHDLTVGMLIYKQTELMLNLHQNLCAINML